MSGMTAIPDLQQKLESLLSQLGNHEQELETLEQKLEQLVTGVVNSGTADEDTKQQISDLENRESDLEDLYTVKRMEICNVRQRLRRAILEKHKQDEKVTKSAISTLSSSSMSNKNRSLNSISPSMRRIEVENEKNREETNKLVNDWQIKLKELEYDKNRKSEAVAYGDVFRGKMRGKDVAIKKFTFQQFDEDTVENFKQEVAVLAKLRHPNVVLFLGAVVSAGNYAIVVEFLPRGSVYDLLHDDTTKLSLQSRMLFAKDAALGMNWLHCSTPPILHLDLKTQNLLVDNNWTLKVSDFGLSRVKKGASVKGRIGSPPYMAPEIINGLPFDERADIYSFGIVLYELFTGDEPYRDRFDNVEELFDAVAKKQFRPDIPESCPASLKDIIQKCWNPSPQNRPSFAALLKTNEFDKILVDILISAPNELGRNIWKKNFLEKTFTTWSSFLTAFAKELGFQLASPDPEVDFQIQCLKEFLVKKLDDTEIVTLEDFGKTLEWFGPLEPGKGILQRMEYLVLFKGFFGSLETSEAEKFLSGKSKGTYLLRFSSKDPGSYAITVISKQGVLKHFRIIHKAGTKYTLGSAEYDSLESLIKANKKDLYLSDPLKGSKYEAMIMSHKKRMASVGYGTDY